MPGYLEERLCFFTYSVPAVLKECRSQPCFGTIILGANFKFSWTIASVNTMLYFLVSQYQMLTPCFSVLCSMSTYHDSSVSKRKVFGSPNLWFFFYDCHPAVVDFVILNMLFQMWQSANNQIIRDNSLSLKKPWVVHMDAFFSQQWRLINSA